MIIDESVEILLEGLDENNITSILEKWKNVNTVKKKLDEIDGMLRNKVKAFLKERKWMRYNDSNTKISVSISTQQREKIDKELLKEFLNESQFAQVVSINTFEKVNIITPESRKVMSKFVKRG